MNEPFLSMTSNNSPMPFLLIFKDASPSNYTRLSPAQRQTLLKEWYDWYDGLAEAGKLRHGHPLEPEGRIVSAHGGRVVDGPFVEANEVVGGYFLLTVSGLEEAVAIAKQCPTLRHDIGLTVEVRPVADLCPALSAENAATEAAAKKA